MIIASPIINEKYKNMPPSLVQIHIHHSQFIIAA
jgi:hypothetical protein